MPSLVLFVDFQRALAIDWNGDLDILFSELTFIGISFLDKPNVIFEEAPWMLMRVSMYGTLRASDFYNTVSENY